MKQFEYKKFYFYATSLELVCNQITNDIGKYGWEVIHIQTYNNHDYDIIAKREIIPQNT